LSSEKFNKEQLLGTLMIELRNHSTLTIMFHQVIASQLGLNPTDHKCLEMILKNEPVTAGRIAEFTGLTTGAVTGVIDRLEKVGFVNRQQDPNDRRRIIIQVNKQKAEESIHPLLDPFAEQISNLLANYNAEQLEFLTKFFNEVNEVLDKETKKLHD